MRWTLWRWVWKLESPLYIGMPPAGSLNRCRLYVPARNIWAAITEKLARGKSSNSFPDYEQVGKCLRENARFTYLFPAESRGKDWIAWLPEFAEEDGLRWRKCGTQETKSDRDFRGMLLDTRPGTALEPTSRTAAEGTLRETECVYALWRHQAEGETKPVGLVGYVFLREQKLACDLKKIERLAIGGDTRYGLGRLKQVNMEQAADVFGLTVVLDKKDPIVRSKTVLAHIPQNCAPCMRGGLEILGKALREAFLDAWLGRAYRRARARAPAGTRARLGNL